jgi:hypothetical protein
MPNNSYEPVHAVFRGWREQKGTKTIKVTEFSGEFPSVNKIGITAKLGRQPNHAYMKAKTLYGLMISALLREPDGSEFRFIKPDTKSVECIMPIERHGELPKGCGFILMEGRCVWPTRQTRDQNNYAATIFKIIPDVLQKDGYLLKQDDWCHLQCGNLGRGWNTKSAPYLELDFFPSPDPMVLVDEGLGLD